VFREKGIEPVSRTEMTSNEAIKQVVEAGLGIAIVSRHTVELELSVDRLAEVPVETFPILRKWYIAQRVNKRLSPAAQAFKEFVLAEGRAQEAGLHHAVEASA
ncbi:MAG: LysR substrate-binding domain-containing protein, partial [Arenicellales bacterium]